MPGSQSSASKREWGTRGGLTQGLYCSKTTQSGAGTPEKAASQQKEIRATKTDKKSLAVKGTASQQSVSKKPDSKEVAEEEKGQEAMKKTMEAQAK